MSVPLSKRKESDLLFFKNALEIRLKLTNLLLRNFGLKDKIRDLSVLSGMKSISEEDCKSIEEIAKKYGHIHPIIERYPYWLIDHFRETILNITRNLISNITAANSIYALCEPEYYERRKYQTAAIFN